MFADNSDLRNPVLSGQINVYDSESAEKLKLILKHFSNQFIEKVVHEAASVHVDSSLDIKFGNPGYFKSRWDNGNLMRYWQCVELSYEVVLIL